MKTRFTFLLTMLAFPVILCSSVLLLAAQDKNPKQSSVALPSLQDEERRFLMDYLKRSRQMMHDAVREVTPAQWIFKAQPFRWSIAECAEHIVLTERWLMSEFAGKYAKGNEPAYIFQWIKPKPKPDEQVVVPLQNRRGFDLFILNDILDRSKVDTSVPRNPPPEVSLAPTGKYKTPAEMLVDFDKQRDETIRIIENLKVDWRQNYIYSGYRNLNFLLDGYQYLLRVPGHCERHLMQLQEVKRSHNYPQV